MSMDPDTKILITKTVLWGILAVFFVVGGVLQHEGAHVRFCEQIGGTASVTFLTLDDMSHGATAMTNCEYATNTTVGDLNVKRLSDNVNEAFGYQLIALEYFLIGAGYLFFAKDELIKFTMKEW